MRVRRLFALALAVLALVASGAVARIHTHGVAPGAPGAKPDFTPADKHGFGTSTAPASKVWFTLEGGELTEIYYPRLDTPSFRDLQFVVTDGHSFVETERDSTSQGTVLVDPRSLTYR
ncbi:MAG: glucoamylase, partial [Solirubrobacteraceae bacterium]